MRSDIGPGEDGLEDNYTILNSWLKAHSYDEEKLKVSLASDGPMVCLSWQERRTLTTMPISTKSNLYNGHEISFSVQNDKPEFVAFGVNQTLHHPARPINSTWPNACEKRWKACLLYLIKPVHHTTTCGLHNNPKRVLHAYFRSTVTGTHFIVSS